jgi:hypothetical protein
MKPIRTAATLKIAWKRSGTSPLTTAIATEKEVLLSLPDLLH